MSVTVTKNGFFRTPEQSEVKFDFFFPGESSHKLWLYLKCVKLTSISAEQTFTSACMFVPNLAHNFPRVVSASFSVQYRVAFSFETWSIDRFGRLWTSGWSRFLNNSKSCSVRSSEFVMSLLTFLLHISILLNLSLLGPPGKKTGIPSSWHSFVFSLSLSSLQAQAFSKSTPSLCSLISSGSSWK